jgi:hypothetical protein
MASPRELVEQCRDAIPGRTRVVVCVLRCQSIKCSYAGAGARATCVQGPLSEADFARGGIQPSGEADPARGSVEAPSEANPARGVAQPSSEADLTRRTSIPRARRTSLEGRFAVPPWRAAGATRIVVVSCMCSRCVS